jgi:ribosomal protein S7
VFKKAVDNAKPSLKCSRAASVNSVVNPGRRLSLAIRWLVAYLRSRGDGKTMEEAGQRVHGCANPRGGAVKA